MAAREAFCNTAMIQAMGLGSLASTYQVWVHPRLTLNPRHLGPYRGSGRKAGCKSQAKRWAQAVLPLVKKTNDNLQTSLGSHSEPSPLSIQRPLRPFPLSPNPLAFLLPCHSRRPVTFHSGWWVIQQLGSHCILNRCPLVGRRWEICSEAEESGPIKHHLLPLLLYPPSRT